MVPSKVESNIKDYGEKHHVVEGDQVLRASTSVMGGITHADWITVRANMGELSFSKLRERPIIGDEIKMDKVLWLESGIGLVREAGMASASGFGMKFGPELVFESR